MNDREYMLAKLTVALEAAAKMYQGEGRAVSAHSITSAADTLLGWIETNTDA